MTDLLSTLASRYPADTAVAIIASHPDDLDGVADVVLVRGPIGTVCAAAQRALLRVLEGRRDRGLGHE